VLSTETVKSEVEVVYRIELIEVTINCEFIYSFIHSFVHSFNQSTRKHLKERKRKMKKRNTQTNKHTKVQSRPTLLNLQF